MTAASEESKPVTAFLIAQNRLLRETLTRVLDKKSDLAILGALALSSGVVEEITNVVPDVLLIDSFTMSIAHQEFIRDVQRDIPGLKLVMFGMEDVLLSTGSVLRDSSSRMKSGIPR